MQLILFIETVLEEEKGIGEYLLRQLSALPEEPRSVTSVTKEPYDPFLLSLAKNISHICKYYCGTLKGNV